MAFSEILKIIPKLDSGELNKMESNLNRKFTNIAKKFGSGLKSTLLGGGVAGLALGLIDKVLNPMKEVKDSIDQALARGDDLATFAKQFNTTAGSLARLQAFGRATGLDPEGVRLLLGKFQASVAQAEANPGKPSAVSNFVGRKDTAEAFFEFIQAMQKLSPVQQNLAQQEVFGEKQILKASEFLQANFEELARKIGGPSAEQLTNAAESLAALSDARDILRSRRELGDIVTKSERIGPQTVGQLNIAEGVQLAQENKRLNSAASLAQIEIQTGKLAKMFEDGYLKLAPVIASTLPTAINELTNVLRIIGKTRGLRLDAKKGDE